MSGAPAGSKRLTCQQCGFTAPVGGAWDEVDHPPLGMLTQCPECGSTRIHGEA